MSLTQYYTVTSLDGFIADPDNSLDWLFTRKGEENGPLSYGDFIADVGAMAMGSTTYEWILEHEFAVKDPAESKWPYDIPCWVFTHRRLPVVRDARIEFTSADIATVHKQMVGAAAQRNVWIVGGGDLAGQFADVGLLDEVILSIAPVTLGGGAPLLPGGSSCVWTSWHETATSLPPSSQSCAHPSDVARGAPPRPRPASGWRSAVSRATGRR